MRQLLRLVNHPWALRIYRMAIVVAVGWLLHQQKSRLLQAPEVDPPLSAVKSIFPKAASLMAPSVEHGWRVVLNPSGNKVGEILTTAPITNNILGYSGPSNVLIGRDSAGVVMGAVLLTSGDTPKHVAMVEKNSAFWEQWKDWNPAKIKAPQVDAVSGASLTSNAVAEGIITRLSGNSLSLRFPAGVTLDEAKQHFPTAAAVEITDPKFTVRDAAGKTLGFLIRTSPSGDNVIGYAGPTECLVSLDADGTTVKLVTLRKSYDTDSYVKQVVEDPHYLSLFAGRTLATLASMDYDKDKIEGVSGSSLTSYAIAESLKQRAQTVLQADPKRNAWLEWRTVDWVLSAFLLGAMVLAYSRWRGNSKVRFLWQCALVVVLGIWAGQLLSLALLGGWVQHGFPWRSAPGLCLLAAVALVFPWASRRQLYCHHICPHGALQSLVGKIFRKKWSLPRKAHRLLTLLPGVTLLVAIVLLAVQTKHGQTADLTLLEPFDAWGVRAAAWVSLGIAIAGLVAALFVPQAYCHYGCPTGALLKYVRSPGNSDKFGLADGVALGLVLALVMLC